MPDPSENSAFRHIPAELVAHVTHGSLVRTADTGERVLEGAVSSKMLFLVISGAISLWSENSDQQRQARAQVQSGEFFGEQAVLGLQGQLTSAIATEPSEVMILDADAIDEILRGAPVQFMRNLSRGAIERLQSSTRASLHDIQLVLGCLVHDLKNPISAATAAAEMIADEPDRDIVARVGIINRSMTRMLSLVQDVLDASRGKTNIQLGIVEVPHLMNELEELILARVRSRGTTVVAQVEFEGIFSGDERAIARALANIIKNAGEANGSGTLTLGTRAADGHVIFRVSDTGPGIHPKVLAGLFDPLVSYGKEGGSGFGMTITKTIAEAHGGAVHLVETSEKGTTFEMVLPLQ